MPLPNITQPISWPFIKSPIFKKSGIATFEILNLSFVAAPSHYSIMEYILEPDELTEKTIPAIIEHPRFDCSRECTASRGNRASVWTNYGKSWK